MTPTAAMTIATSGPTITSAAKSTACAIDIVEAPLPSGSLSLKTDRPMAAASSAAPSTGCGSSRGMNRTTSSVPMATTTPT